MGRLYFCSVYVSHIYLLANKKTLPKNIWSVSNNRIYMLTSITYKEKKKMHHRTDFEADIWQETGDVFSGLEDEM